MECVYREKKISGILGILPEEISDFEDELDNYSFPHKQSLRLKRLMGYDKHRLSKKKSTASDFCVYGLKYLLSKGKIRKDDIGAIIVVTLSPDYFVPHISNIIHGECHLSQDVLCMDILQGCAGYLLGLMQAFMVSDFMKDKKILLFNTDVLSHKVSKHDRNSFPLIGDATSITIIEHDSKAVDSFFQLYADGEGRNALIIPAGGFAMPATEETSQMRQLEDGNSRSLNDLCMDGTKIFDFVMTKVPPLINSALKKLNLDEDEIDYFLFHQPNKFMLQKIADAIGKGISSEKLFMNVVENYGNSSGASIPINIIHNLSDKIVNSKYKCCLSAFGSGLTYGLGIMELGNLDFCQMITSDL